MQKYVTIFLALWTGLLVADLSEPYEILYTQVMWECFNGHWIDAIKLCEKIIQDEKIAPEYKIYFIESRDILLQRGECASLHKPKTIESP